MNSRTYSIAWLGTEGIGAVQREATSWGVPRRSKVPRRTAQLARLVEGIGVIQPERPRRPIDRLRLDPALLALTFNQYGATASSGYGSCWTAEIERRTTLGRHD